MLSTHSSQCIIHLDDTTDSDRKMPLTGRLSYVSGETGCSLRKCHVNCVDGIPEEVWPQGLRGRPKNFITTNDFRPKVKTTKNLRGLDVLRVSCTSRIKTEQRKVSQKIRIHHRVYILAILDSLCCIAVIQLYVYIYMQKQNQQQWWTNTLL